MSAGATVIRPTFLAAAVLGGGLLLACAGSSTEVTAQELEQAKAYLTPTPELLAKGREVFAANCASCHGKTGEGDGVSARMLGQSPRSFKTARPEEYLHGVEPLQLYRTLKRGLGANMPAFPALTMESKFAVIHYARSLMPLETSGLAPVDRIDAPTPGVRSISADRTDG